MLRRGNGRCFCALVPCPCFRVCCHACIVATLHACALCCTHLQLSRCWWPASCNVTSFGGTFASLSQGTAQVPHLAVQYLQLSAVCPFAGLGCNPQQHQPTTRSHASETAPTPGR